MAAELGPGKAARPGGRSARIRDAVLSAAASELLDVGFERLSISSVARRAGVHHTTIYRRWRSRSRLVLDALLELTSERAPAPDLGDLRSDLTSYFRSLTAAFAEPRAAALIRSLIALPAEQFADERRAYWRERFAVSGEIVCRAVSRGELPPQADAWRIVELIAGRVWMRALMTGLPIDGKFLHEAIEDAIRAVSR